MKTDLAELSRAYQDRLQAARPAPGAACPPLDRLARCALDEMPEGERAEVVGHAADCSACATALKRLLSLAEDTDAAAAALAAELERRQPGTPRPHETFWARFGLRQAVAAMTVILAVAVLAVFVPKLLVRTGTRGGSGAGIVLTSPGTGGTPRDGLVFKWQGLAGAEAYIVEVFDSSLRLVWRSGRLAGTEVRLPDEAARRLVPGGAYYWSVKTAGPGAPPVASKLAEFSVLK